MSNNYVTKKTPKNTLDATQKRWLIGLREGGTVEWKDWQKHSERMEALSSHEPPLFVRDGSEYRITGAGMHVGRILHARHEAALAAKKAQIDMGEVVPGMGKQPKVKGWKPNQRTL